MTEHEVEEQEERLLSSEEGDDEGELSELEKGRGIYIRLKQKLCDRFGATSFEELLRQKRVAAASLKRSFAISQDAEAKLSRKSLKYRRAEAVPSAARIAKLLNLGRIDEVRTSVVALQSDAKAAKAQLKLAEQTAGIATRDYNELWERFQQLQHELSEAQARLVERAEELEHVKVQLQQQEDMTRAEGQRADALVLEVAGGVTKMQELQVQVLSGKALASALARPETFDGKDLLTGKAMQGQKVVQWTTAVKRYCQALKLSESQHVSVAVSLLRGAAAQAWTSAEAVLLGNNTEITLDHVRECLLKRFTPAATAHTVRTALAQLKQQGQYAPIAAYVTQFDALCSKLQ
jgi:hypothetical protein